jgi:chaperonin GroEL
MNSKKLVFDKIAREKLLEGARDLARAVGVTLGPRGRNVLIGNKDVLPTITNDGVTIARHIKFKDEVKDIGALVIRDVASKTNDDAGDGTTTATVLAYEMLKKGINLITSGSNPVLLSDGIDAAVADITDELKNVSIDISTKEEIASIGEISGQNKELGKVLGDVFDKVGVDSLVTIENASKKGFGYDMIEGYQLDSGYRHPAFVTNGKLMKSILENPSILIMDQPLSNPADLGALLESVAQSGNNKIVIIAHSFTPFALQKFAIYNGEKMLQILPIVAPAISGRRSAMLNDLSVVVGTKLIGGETGVRINDFKLKDLGSATRVESSSSKTIFISPGGDEILIQERSEFLNASTKEERSEYEQEIIKERIAKLGSGLAVIQVGAKTEIEENELVYKVEDALNACRAAIEEGIVPGGGCTLANIAKKLRTKNRLSSPKSNEYANGYNLVIDAIESPLRKIAENAGDNGDLILKEIQKSSSGYDARNKKPVVDMVKNGIVDPVKVTRSAVQNAASAVKTLLTTEVCIIDEETKNIDSKADR